MFKSPLIILALYEMLQELADQHGWNVCLYDSNYRSEISLIQTATSQRKAADCILRYIEKTILDQKPGIILMSNMRQTEIWSTDNSNLIPEMCKTITQLMVKANQ